MRFHRERASVPKICVTVPSSVHVLRSEEELREAVERAAEFHEQTATLLRTRFERYEALLTIRVDRPVLD
jgi:hypothetical protein